VSLTRLAAFAWREMRELWRDRARLTSAFLVPAALLLVVGFGLSLDVEDLKYAVLDRDGTPASRSYLEPFAHSRYFDYRGALDSPRELERALVAADVTLVIDVPRGFQRDLVRGSSPEVAFWLDGTLPFSADVAAGYVAAMHRAWVRSQRPESATVEPVVETRFWYNPGLRSAISFVPGLVAALLGMFPAMVAAMGFAREKELGTIVNLHATPLGRLEFILGKQAPYAALGLLQFVVLLALALTVFRAPARGDVTALVALALLYAWALTGLGILVASFVGSQIQALLITMIVTMLPAWVLSGVFTPVTSMSGPAQAIAAAFPTTYFLDACVAVMTKGLGGGALAGDALALGAFALGFDLLALALLKEQAP
jgi:ribosome-dependent ATPase